MKLSSLAFILCLAVPLGACAQISEWVNGPADQQVGTGAAYICSAAAFGLEGAREAFADLGDEAKGHITHAAVILNPVCSMETRPTLDSTAHAALSAALKELLDAVPQAAPALAVPGKD